MKISESKRTCCFVGEECFIERRCYPGCDEAEIRLGGGGGGGMKEEQLEVVVAFLSGSDVLPFFVLDLGRVSAMHACLFLSSC